MTPNPITFLDVLRRRRELPLLEVARLCADLPKLLDERTRRRQGVALGVGCVTVEIAGGVADEAKLLGTPVTSWPVFTVKISECSDETGEQTMANPRQAVGGTGPSAFARLLYELLGGKKRVGVVKRPPPLPALNEEGNTILRQALVGEMERETCAAFWQRWLRACDVKVMAAGWRIPRWLLPVSQFGNVLHLTPQGEGDIPISLVARPVFRIGRSRSMTDYPTRIMKADGSVDEEATVLLSRVQAVAEAGPLGISLRDGNGQKASANGSSWNGEPLSSKQGILIEGPGELQLGGAYTLSVAPTVGPAEGPRSIENFAEWWTPGPEPDLEVLDFAAVVFWPLKGQRATRDAVWVGRGVGINLAKEGGFSWDLTAPRSPAEFVFAHGGFWLANASMEQNAIRLNDAALGPGQIAPLANTQTLEIGGRRFAGHVE